MALTPAQRARIINLPEPYFLISAKPTEHALILAKGVKVIFAFYEALTADAVWLRLAGDTLHAEIKVFVGRHTFKLATATGAGKWLKLPCGPVSAGTTISIEATDATTPIYLTGLQFDPVDKHDWP